VVLSIAVGVFAVGMVTNTYLVLSNDSRESYVSVNPSSAFITVSDFDDQLEEVVRNIPEVDDADGRRVRTVRLNLRGNWYSAQLTGLEFGESRLNLIESTGGETVPEDRQLLIDQTTLFLTEFEIGDMAIVEMSNGRRYEMPVVGIVRDLNSNPSINSGGINAYVTLDTFPWLGEPTNYNRLAFTTVEGQTDFKYLQTVMAKVKERIERGGWTVFGSILMPEPGVNPVNFIIEAMRIVLGTMALVSLVLSAFLVFNTMSALLVSQVKQIGIMKAIGANSRDLVAMYLVLVVVFGLIAFAIAVVPAAIAADKFSQFVAGPRMLDLKLQPYRIPPTVLGLELFVSILVPILGALPAVLSGAGITVHDAISAHGLGDKFGVNMLDRLLGKARSVTGPWILSVGNILRNKRRVIFTLATLVLGGAVFIGVMSVRESAAETVNELGQAYRFDVEVTLARPYRMQELERHALQVPGVERVEGWATAAATLLYDNGEEGNVVRILAPPIGSNLTQPKIVEGRWLLPEDEYAIVIDSSLLREDPSLALGDTLRLKIDGRAIDWTIVGIYRFLGVSFVYNSYANYPTVNRITRDANAIQRLQLVTTRHDPAFQSAVAERISERFRDLGIRVSSVDTSSGLRNVQVEQFNIVVVVLTAMSLLILLVGGLGLAGTMSMNVMERTREIGVMRAVGAADGMVIRIVIVEGLLMAILSWIAAVVLAWPVGLTLGQMVGRELVNGPLSYVYSVTGMAIWLLLVLSIAVLASYGPALKASRLAVQDVLAYE
jgi:putative ABC transport system permease protein